MRRYVEVKLHWDAIPYEGELSLGVTLTAQLNARLETGHENMAGLNPVDP